MLRSTLKSIPCHLVTALVSRTEHGHRKTFLHSLKLRCSISGKSPWALLLGPSNYAWNRVAVLCMMERISTVLPRLDSHYVDARGRTSKNHVSQKVEQANRSPWRYSLAYYGVPYFVTI